MQLPIFIENSKVPVVLSKVAPIKIWAINIGPFVWCRGTLTEATKQHECIHWEQQKELLIFGFLALYAFYYFKNLIKLKNGSDAYRSIPFEMEAFRNEHVNNYIKIRKRYEWLRYI